MFFIHSLAIENSLDLEGIHRKCFTSYWDHTIFKSFLKQKTTYGWMVETPESTPAGFILARMAGQESEILTFAVTPLYQGKGAGRLLLETLIHFTRKAHCNKIFIEVAVDNKSALALYTSLNFKVVGLRPKYYDKKDEPLTDAYIMSTNL